MSVDLLSNRERRVLEATIQTYIETAEPAGSQTVARRSGLGISPATVRSAMSDLEARGYLFHVHTSGGRIPTDLAYRAYVDALIEASPPTAREKHELHETLRGSTTAFEEILRRAAQVLSVLTHELGVAAAPALDQAILERLDLVAVASDRLLLVLNIQKGLVRTIFVSVPASIAPESIDDVARILNERLAGLTLSEIRRTLPERLRDASETRDGEDLLNIFLAEGEDIFDTTAGEGAVLLGSAQHLAGQPEFASNERMRELLGLTERQDLLRKALEGRRRGGMTISIGEEHTDPGLSGLTLVTNTYRVGDLTGVIGVLGPTRMPYRKIIGLVEHTSRLVEGLMQ